MSLAPSVFDFIKIMLCFAEGSWLVQIARVFVPIFPLVVAHMILVLSSTNLHLWSTILQAWRQAAISVVRSFIHNFSIHWVQLITVVLSVCEWHCRPLPLHCANHNHNQITSQLTAAAAVAFSIMQLLLLEDGKRYWQMLWSQPTSPLSLS